MDTSFSRSVRIHGGVAILMREDVRYVPIDLDDFAVEIEAEIAAVKIPDQNLVIIAIYRSPTGSLDTFMYALSRVFNFLSVCSLNVILTGDFNVHFQDSSDPSARDLYGFLREYGMSSDFCAPTRFANCLENAFANTQVPLRTAVVGCAFSDHNGLESAYYIRSLRGLT